MDPFLFTQKITYFVLVCTRHLVDTIDTPKNTERKVNNNKKRHNPFSQTVYNLGRGNKQVENY